MHAMRNGRCPHFVRHGRAEGEQRKLVFYHKCGLKMRTDKQVSCLHFPFTDDKFSYTSCNVYQQIFKPSATKNDAVPTSDLQYNEPLSSELIADMRLL